MEVQKIENENFPTPRNKQKYILSNFAISKAKNLDFVLIENNNLKSQKVKKKYIKSLNLLEIKSRIKNYQNTKDRKKRKECKFQIF